MGSKHSLNSDEEKAVSGYDGPLVEYDRPARARFAPKGRSARQALGLLQDVIELIEILGNLTDREIPAR